MTVGERIKRRREQLNLSQKELASMMGISRQAVSKAELHDNNITTDKVSKFAKALNCTEAELMGWTETVETTNEINDKEARLVAYFCKLSQEQQESVLNLIKNMI